LKSLNKQVQENQESNHEWRYNKQAMSANRVFATINANLFGGKLPDPVIGFNNSGRLKKDGAYHWEGDGISLPHHIDLRQDLTELETVVAGIHNGTHMSMEIYHESQYWYHSKPFRDTMQKFGIKTDKNGNTIGFYKAFGDTLEKIGRPDLATELFEPDDTEGLIGDVVVGGDDTPVVDVHVNPLLTPSTLEVEELVVPMPTKTAAPKVNKQKKWTCGCINVRCAVELDATCNKCGNHFELGEGGPKELDVSVAKELEAKTKELVSI
jgi:hypothetical protein